MQRVVSTSIKLAILITTFSVIARPTQAQTRFTLDVFQMGDLIMVDGTNVDDVVTVSITETGMIRVRANAQNFDFPGPATGPDAPGIMFTGWGGNDSFVNMTPLTAIAFGGAGEDRLVATEGVAVFAGEGGADVLLGGEQADTLDGGLGEDRIFGAEGGDNITAGGGADRVEGGSGDDTISGGLGGDTVFGQDGNDIIRTGNGEDFASGGAGDDVIEGGSNDDELVGSSGIDTLVGGLGNDLLTGGLGNDRLCGERGDDELFGNGDDDSLFGGEGVDLLDGGAGTNVLDQDSDGCFIPGLAFMSTVVEFPRAQTRDTNNNGIADPGDIFELDMLFTAGPNGAQNVSFGRVFTITGPARQVGGVGGSFGNLGPNQTARTLANSSDACMSIDSNANAGDQIFVEFDVNAGGESARFRAGPFVVGQIMDGQTNRAVLVGN